MSRVPEQVLGHPAIQRLKRIAQALGELNSLVVFIGGAISPLLQTEPPFDEPRPTKDVDGVIASTKYSDLGPLHDALRAHGFRQMPGETKHIHRWYSSTDDVFDLVPAGAHPGGSGQVWDRLALDTCVQADLGDGIVIRHASAPAFLGLKWAAYADRGAQDPFGSHDLEDIVALVASRATVAAEVYASPAGLRAFVVEQTLALLNDARLEDLLAGHLNNAQDPVASIDVVRSRLVRIGRLGELS